eukprot:TRINITY_DN1744_c0_g1_i7.p1 TRINITY_DN1744_c0_g1~~TRINITY_DN1744_c0_g1_i7.p1  ORF type:complete len:150 (+),score=26.99 TRINITY_DN1744_c0_g1_i7:83-532(+)
MAKEVSADDLKDCFNALDTESKAHLTKAQVKLGVRALGKNPTEAEINAKLKDLPEDIAFTSFKSVYQSNFSTPQGQDSKAREILRMLDPNNDGMMKESDFRQMMSTIGEAMDHNEVDALMEECPTNANGYFRYEDFISMLVTGYMEHLQ